MKWKHVNEWEFFCEKQPPCTSQVHLVVLGLFKMPTTNPVLICHINMMLVNLLENTATLLKTLVDEWALNTSSQSTTEMLTWHVHHPAVAVLHNVASFTVNSAGRYAVDLKEARLQSLGLTLSPWGRQVGQLRGRREPGVQLAFSANWKRKSNQVILFLKARSKVIVFLLNYKITGISNILWKQSYIFLSHTSMKKTKRFQKANHCLMGKMSYYKWHYQPVELVLFQKLFT